MSAPGCGRPQCERFCLGLLDCPSALAAAKRFGLIPRETDLPSSFRRSFQAFLEAHSFSGEESRPFSGQNHTWTGARGRDSLPPMRYRDLGDTIVRACAELGVEGMDLDALAQHVLYLISRRGP